VRSRSVRKGRRGEQEIARLLYKAWFGEEPPAERSVFVRTGLGRKQPHGDIVVPSDFPYIVEVKNRNFQLHEITPRFVEECIHGRRLPVAIFLKLCHKWYVVVVDSALPCGECLHFHGNGWSATLYPLRTFLDKMRKQ